LGLLNGVETKGKTLKIPYRRLIAAVGVAALVGSGSALAHGGNGHAFGKEGTTGATGASGPTGATGPNGNHGHANGKHKPHKVAYIFKGTWTASDGTVKVTAGNSRVRKGGFIGKNVQFDLTNARLVVADTNNDGSRTVADRKDGKKVLVQARLPRKDPGDPPYAARKLVDQTHPPVKHDH
jgi:hypothetical protein